MLWLVSSASAAAVVTRYVDDDHAQCPQATFTKIQAAIDASAAHDIVRVCAGTYREQLTLPAAKTALMVASLPALAAHVMAPASGLTAYDDAYLHRRMDLIQVLGSQQHVLGLSIAGPLTPHIASDGCAAAAAIEVDADDVVLDGNALSGLADDTCSGQTPSTTGIRVGSGSGAVVERGTIQGAREGVELDGAAQTVVENNTIVGRGSGVDGTWGLYVLSDAGQLSARSNDISAMNVGMLVAFAGGLVKGNVLHDNGTGLELSDGMFADIDSNVIRHNTGDGLYADVIGKYGNGSYAPIRLNDVRYNGHDGIAIYGCGLNCGLSPTSYQLDRNVSLSNGRYDCFDVAAFNDTWTGNIGVTASPSALCSPH